MVEPMKKERKLLGKMDLVRFIPYWNTIYFGKFIIFGTIWSFTFQILSEIRHLFWDMGLGFELKTANITGLLVIFGSFIATIAIFILGRGLI